MQACQQMPVCLVRRTVIVKSYLAINFKALFNRSAFFYFEQSGIKTYRSLKNVITDNYCEKRYCWAIKKINIAN